MSDLHELVDFENVQPTFEQVAKLAPGVSEVWLLHGPHQIKLAEQFKAAHEGVTPVPISKTGKNALDFQESTLGKDTTPAAVQQIVRELETTGVIQTSGDTVQFMVKH